MNEAFQELERVKEEIAQLKKVRDDAQRQIIAAKLEVAKSKHAAQPASSSAAAAAAAAATSTAPSYSSKEYWTERYNPTPSSTLAGVDAAVYEWYASYAVLSKLISASIERCSDRTSASLFLPGCGNSELGECIAADHPGELFLAFAAMLLISCLQARGWWQWTSTHKLWLSCKAEQMSALWRTWHTERCCYPAFRSTS